MTSIGIVDFNPNQDPDTRQYSRRISAFFPEGVKWDKLFYRDNFDFSPYDALFLTGSRLSAYFYQKMVKDRVIGSDYEDVHSVVEQLSKYEKPMFGICFGAQLLAYVKGGKLGRLDEIEAGYLMHDLTEDAKQDKVFGPLPEKFYGAQFHKDYVAELPKNGNVLAMRNGIIHAFKVIDSHGVISYGVQPHPEMSTPDDKLFLVNANSGWFKDEVGVAEFEKSLSVPNTVDFELSKTITRFVESVSK